VSDDATISAASWGFGHYTVMSRGTDNLLYQTSWVASKWTPWRVVPHRTPASPIQGGPSVTSRGQGQLDVFVWGTDNIAYQFWQ
jgi:hypothetical protein